MAELDGFQQFNPDEELSIEIAKLPSPAQTLLKGLIQQQIPRDEAFRLAIKLYSEHRQNLPPGEQGK